MPLTPNARFDTFTILRRLGRGGMATVYLAREDRPSRQVALKVLPEQFSDEPGFAARFEQEAELIANLDHPNIIPLYRYGVTEDVPWMALRYVDGGDFADRLTRPLAIAEGLDILRAVAAALDYAHRRGIVHRDLKPQNVLLSTDHATYLADFGIAKMLEGSQKLKTATGGVLGTPAYMAPEQAQGQALGPYTDAYAFAVICFQWLTGALPFDADTPHAILMKHVLEPVPAEGLARLPERVAAVLRRGLAKRPAERHASVGELFRDLERALLSGFDVAAEADEAPAPPRTPAPEPTPIAATTTPAPQVAISAAAAVDPAPPVAEPEPMAAGPVAPQAVVADPPAAAPRAATIIVSGRAPDPFAPKPPAPARPPAATPEPAAPPEAIAAGFWRRYLAYAIDLLLVAIPLVGGWYLLGEQRRAIGLSDFPFTDPAVLGIDAVALAVYLLLNAALDSSTGQGSLGKRCTGLKVTDAVGGRLRFRTALTRLLMRTVAVLSLGVGGAVAARGPAYLAWHDRITGTRVVARGARPEDLAGEPARRKMRLSWWIVVVAVLASPLVLYVGLALLFTASAQVDYQVNNATRIISSDVLEVKTPIGRRQWTRKDNGADVDRAGAIAYCAGLALDGGGWRLPDWDEGLALADDSGWNATPCFDPLFQRDSRCHVSAAFQLGSSQVWLAYQSSDAADKGWFMQLNQRYPSITAATESKGMRALCVRPAP